MDAATGTCPSRRHATSLAYWLIALVTALLCLGALMVFSAGATLDQRPELKYFRQTLFALLAWGLLLLASRVDYHRVLAPPGSFCRAPVVLLVALSVLLLTLVWVPGIGRQVNGARRWIELGPLTVQPSELAKWSLLLFLPAYCVWRGEKIRRLATGFLPACAVLLLVVALIGKEDFGTAALIGAVGVMALILGGVRWRHLLILLPLAALAFYLLVYRHEYRWDRVLAWWHSDRADRAATAYQARQSIMALGSGGLWGCGLGCGTIKMGWLPEDTTDFVFAVIGEELGFAGCALVILLFIALLVCGWFIMRRAPDRLGRQAAATLTGAIGAQAAFNLLVVTGLGPTKGIALPFVSAGGSGLIITALAAGVLANIARQGRRSSEKHRPGNGTAAPVRLRAEG